jgi:PAS domain S-box-containing protein
MADARTHLLLFAIDDLRELITQMLAPFHHITYAFVTDFPELIQLVDDQPPTFILCRPEVRYLMPVSTSLILICDPEDLALDRFIAEPGVVDLLFADDFRRLPFILHRSVHYRQPTAREIYRLRAIIDYIPYGIIEVDMNSRAIQWSNSAMSQLFGYSTAELIDLHFEDFYPMDVRAQIVTLFQRMLTGDSSSLANILCQRRDGTTFYCNIVPGGMYGNGQRLIFIFFADVTTEYQSLQTLQINAQRLELALRAANQGLYDIDLQSGATTVTDAYATMLGYDPAAFIETNQSWRERIHPADVDRAYQAYLDYLAGRIPEYRVEFRSRMRQGGWKWILSVGAIVERDEQGHPLRMMGTHTDISALKRLEFQERLRVQLFTSLLGGGDLNALMNILLQAFEDEQPDTRCAVVLFDPGGHQVTQVIAPHLPQPLIEALKQPEPHLTNPLWQLLITQQRVMIPDLQVDPLWAVYAKPAREHGLVTLWAEAIFGTGGVIIGAFTVWSARVAVAENEELALLQFAGHLAGPVIEQHVIAERLRLSEERYALAERAVQDGVWDWDITNGVTYLSPQWKAMFGFTEDELPNTITTFFERIHPDDWPAVTKALDRHFAGQEPFHMEFRMRYRDDKYRWVLARGEVLRNEDGHVVRMVGALSDITERKHLDERIRETQKLEALGLLTGGLAHDFNNLLGIIIGNLDLLLSGWQGDEETRQILEAALKASLRGAELTKSLLAVARRQPLAPTTIDVCQIVREFLPLIQVTVGSAIKVELIEQTTVTVRADRAGLEAALLNLVINSRDAMPHGGSLIVRVREQRVTDEDTMLLAILSPGCYVSIDVVDTGTGMTPEVAERAFEPFFTTKERGRGTGLGLAMVYGFARQSGGTAQIYSTSGLGTTIRLYLPCAGELPSEEVPSVPITERRDARILVVDDDTALLQITVKTLLALGYTVAATSDGQTALARLQAEPFDLLLTDVVMPGMDGPTLAARARQVDPKLKVLYISGFAALQGIDLNDEHVLEKPFRSSTLEVAVQQALSD